MFRVGLHSLFSVLKILNIRKWLKIESSNKNLKCLNSYKKQVYDLEPLPTQKCLYEIFNSKNNNFSYRSKNIRSFLKENSKDFVNKSWKWSQL